MKISFSLSSKAQPEIKRPTGGDEGLISNREYITEFDSSDSPPDASKNLVIPPKPNEWNPQKSQEALQFDVVSTSVNATADFVAYGLNLRDATVESNSNQIPGVDPSLQKLREDLDRLPDATGLDDYEEVPIEGYGRAILAGYGWHDGMGIGRNAKEDVKSVQLKSWSGRKGLGFKFSGGESCKFTARTNTLKETIINRWKLPVGFHTNKLSFTFLLYFSE